MYIQVSLTISVYLKYLCMVITTYLNCYSTPENDMMAFIDDDSLVDDRRDDECRGPCPSPTMSPSPPLLQNGWSSSFSPRVKQQQEIPKVEPQIPSANVNNNNNNNNIGNVNNGTKKFHQVSTGIARVTDAT